MRLVCKSSKGWAGVWVGGCGQRRRPSPIPNGGKRDKKASCKCTLQMIDEMIRKRVAKNEDKLALLSTRTQGASSRLPSMVMVAVRLNLACSLAAAFCFFCALTACPVPMTVGMAAMVSKPMTMFRILLLCAERRAWRKQERREEKKGDWFRVGEVDCPDCLSRHLGTDSPSLSGLGRVKTVWTAGRRGRGVPSTGISN